MDCFSEEEREFINSLENYNENIVLINEFKQLVAEKGLNENVFNICRVNFMHYTLDCGIAGVFAFSGQWYIYSNGERFDEYDIYGPFSTKEAVERVCGPFFRVTHFLEGVEPMNGSDILENFKFSRNK